MDDSSFFGTPEVVLRPRQRHGGDQGDYPTPVAGFSTNKKLRENMSFSAFSPGSVLRKPFYDVSAALPRHRSSGVAASRRRPHAIGSGCKVDFDPSAGQKRKGGHECDSRQQAARKPLANGIPERNLVPILRMLCRIGLVSNCPSPPPPFLHCCIPADHQR